MELCCLCVSRPAAVEVFCLDCASAESGVPVRQCIFCKQVLFGDQECSKDMCKRHKRVLENPFATYDDIMEAEAASHRACGKKKRRVSIDSSTDGGINASCCICFDSVEDKNVALTCGHVFHDGCIRKWFDMCSEESNVASCPMCRKVQ